MGDTYINIFMRGDNYLERKLNRVKIKEIKINKLYDMYNYDIKFNEDITFLHGKNGCGKTTILNIITYIITGKIYKLFSYDFENIILEYRDDKRNNNIVFNKIENDIEINFGNEKKLIEKKVMERILREVRNEESRFEPRGLLIDEASFKEYSILRKIKELFEFVYIPLNRNDLADRERMMQYRGYRSLRLRENLEEAIYNIEHIILNNYAKIQSEISRLGKMLQINIVKSMYQYNNESDLIMQDSLEKSDAQKDIENFKKANLYDDELAKQIKNFYQKLIKKNDDKESIDFTYILNASKIAQLNKIREVFNEYDEKVKELNEPIDKLQKIVTNFFEDSAEKKELVIVEDDIYFLTEHGNRKVKLDSLSSGEKQILILFTYLIFDVANREKPIFIIDEPELSLHLLWQKNFVNSVLETNPNMQLILATHAPEIIDKYRDKAYKVELNVN